jgi:hypothetical protein
MKALKACETPRRIQMENIPNQIRAKLKRLCPYAGPYIPNSVRENAKHLWSAPSDPDKYAGWQWDDGSGFYQCELELCDMDAETIDPTGYVAIRPLGQDKCALIFVIGIKWADGFDPSCLIFDTMQEAKYYLDTLLAADTPEIRSQ